MSKQTVDGPVRVVVPLPKFGWRHAENLNWMEHARCNGMNPEEFFPKRLNGTGADSAEKIINKACERCPVADECFQYGRDIRATDGIFGGTNFGAHRRKNSDDD